MALSKTALASDILVAFEKNINSEYEDEYEFSKELVDAIYSYIALAQVKITVAGIHSSSGATDPDFGSDGLALSIADYEDDSVRVALEASWVASFQDTGDSNLGQTGFKIFCMGAEDSDEISLWKSAIDHIYANNDRDLDFDPDEIKDDYMSGYSFFISTLVNWTDGNYAPAEAATEMTDTGGRSMFSDMKSECEQNMNLSSSAENAATDIADVIHDATTGSTVTSIFASVSGYAQASPETVSIE